LAKYTPGLSDELKQGGGSTHLDNTFAVVQTGGKQYKVTPGAVIEVETLPVEAGGTVELDRVLLLSDGDKVTVGMPTVAGAKVVATVQAHDRGEKIIVFKYKAKTRHRVKTGHRQNLTRLAIKEIVAG
jgi:large subunit ribosomal protein L21